jgi:peptidoglycan/LPS O-acetylase OafA/YrhL
VNAPYRLDGQVKLLTSYRPFIDGLRAVSILAVVLYHVGVPGVSGGFVGVDVFFVISGFLIISQIVQSLGHGSFSFGEFWSRRALRILPPYLLVIAAITVLATYVLIMPDEFKDFSREVRDGALIVINHLFLSQQGYFDTASDSKILLNMWSLSVEEQFYFVAPCLLAVLWWLPAWLKRPGWRPRLLLWTSMAAFFASLVGCILFTIGGDNYSFYLSALRAWEFAAGGAVGYFLPLARRLPQWALGWVATAGLTAIIGAAVSFRPDMLYPSWAATVPAFGATAVILAGTVDPKLKVIRLLATPQMVWIGLVSYSWYLWHWPLLALWRIRHFGDRSLTSDALIAVVSLGLAATTYYCLERPIRHWRQQRKTRLGWRPVFAGIVICIAAAIAGFQTMRAYAHRHQDEIAALMSASPSTADFCDLMTGTAASCAAAAKGRPVGLIIGDSQMLAARNVLARHLEAKGIFPASMASLACGAFLETKLFVGRYSADCNSGRRNAISQLRRGVVVPAYAILFSQWYLYGDPRHRNLGAIDAERPAADQPGAFVGGLRGTIETLRALGVGRVLIVGTPPVFTRSAVSCVYRADKAGLDRDQECGIERVDADQTVASAREKIAVVTADLPDVRYVDPIDDFCDLRRCRPYSTDALLFSDLVHVTDAGASAIIANHQADFDWAMGETGKPQADGR